MVRKLKNSLIRRVISNTLVILYVLSFGSTRGVLASTAESQNYRLTSGTLNGGGESRRATSTELWQDAIGGACVGKLQSANYILNAGFIFVILSNVPIQTQIIPNQIWLESESLVNVFNLDDYFLSPDGLSLTYTVSGNSNIIVTIDPDTHMVTFSQDPAWYGIEIIKFIATDNEYNSTTSNEVILEVQEVKDPPLASFTFSPEDAIVDEAVVFDSTSSYDPDGEIIRYNWDFGDGNIAELEIVSHSYMEPI
jgi:hypothetical protein